MAIDPPYRLDPFQNIVNVRWVTATRIYLWYFVFTQVIPGANPYGNSPDYIAGTWSGPFKYVYANTYNENLDPPEPEPSDPYPDTLPNFTGQYFQERTYSLDTFKVGPADWINAAGNWWQNTSTYWYYRSVGDVTIFTANTGYASFPDYDHFIGMGTTGFPSGYVNPIPEGYTASEYPFPPR